MIEIKEVINKRDFLDFVKFPFKLYKNSKFWVPPIIKDELESFDKTKNPAFQSADTKFYLAYNKKEIVGRIAVIINWIEVKEQNKSKLRFGWFDFIDDIEVSKALLEKAYEFGRENNLEHAEGPVGFSNLDKVGVLTEGFDQVSTMITWYNYPYYKDHYENLGFSIEKQYIEEIFPFKNVEISHFEKVKNLIKRRYQLKAVNFNSTEEVMAKADRIFDLFNATYSKLSSFTPIKDNQKDYFKKKYLNFINPEYIKFVEDKDDNLIAFSIVIPSFAKALKKSKGKLFPFGLFHLLNAKKNSKDVVFYLIGVLPEYQNKGVTAIIFDEYHKTFTKKGVINCIRTPSLVENNSIHNIWKHFNPVINKKRCTYKKYL